MRISARLSALGYIAFASSLSAQQQQWTVEYTEANGIHCVDTNMWNAGRMTTRVQCSKDGQQSNASDSFTIFEVQFDDPKEFTAGTAAVVAWRVKATCREGSENRGNCINHTKNGEGNVEGRSTTAILFSTRDAAMAFLNFFRK